MSRRQPWPWEDASPTYVGAEAPDMARVVALPPDTGSTGGATIAGELSRRDTVERLEADLRGIGIADGRARELARGAAIDHDAGVRTGRITRPR